MSSRKNEMGGNAFDYIDVEDTNQDIVALREQIKEMDQKIEDLADEVDKLNNINSFVIVLESTLLILFYGLTDGK